MIISFFCSTLAIASPTLDNLDQNNGIAALQAGDAIGLEVIQRSELESVRGEVIPLVLMPYIYEAGILAMRYGIPFALNYVASASNNSWALKQEIKYYVMEYYGW